MCRAAVRSAAVKWLAPKPIVGRPSHLEPEARVVGQRQPARVAGWWPCSCGRMYGTYWSVTVLSKRPTTWRRAGRSSLPRAAAVPVEPLEAGPERRARRRCAARRGGPARARRRSRRAARRRRAAGSAGGERRPAPAARWTMLDLEAGRVRARRARGAARAGRGRARASAGGRPLRRSAAAAGRRCRSARARAAAAGRSTRTLRPSSASSRSTPVVEVDDRAHAVGLEHAVAAGRTARPARAPRGATGRASCCHATSCPAGAHSVAARRKKRKVTNRSPSAAAAGRARRRGVSPGGDAQRRQAAALAPLAVDGQLPLAAVAGRATRSGGGCGCGSGRRRRASTRTGCARNFSSCSAGWGVRSGQTIPSAQKFASCGDVAEVAAVGPVLAAALVASAGCRGRPTPR